MPTNPDVDKMKKYEMEYAERAAEYIVANTGDVFKQEHIDLEHYDGSVYMLKHPEHDYQLRKSYYSDFIIDRRGYIFEKQRPRDGVFDLLCKKLDGYYDAWIDYVKATGRVQDLRLEDI